MNDTPQVDISPEVEAAIGAEQAQRYRTDPALVRGDCWSCRTVVDGTTEPVTVLCQALQLAGGTVHLATIAHAACSPSSVRHLSEDEVAQLLADRRIDTTDDDGGRVTAVATVWPVGTEHTRPTVLVSFDADVITYSAIGERVSAITSSFLEQGWHLTTGGLGRTPPTVLGCRITWNMSTLNRAAPGRFLLTQDTPAGTAVHADIDPLYPGGYWLPAALRAGATAVYIGPFHLDQLGADDTLPYAAIQRAVKSGEVVGGIVPVEVYQPDGAPYTLPA